MSMKVILSGIVLVIVFVIATHAANNDNTNQHDKWITYITHFVSFMVGYCKDYWNYETKIIRNGEEENRIRQTSEEHAAKLFWERAKSMRDMDVKKYEPWIDNTPLQNALNESLTELVEIDFGVKVLLAPVGAGKSARIKVVSNLLKNNNLISGCVEYDLDIDNVKNESLYRHMLNTFGAPRTIQSIEALIPAGEKPVLLVIDQVDEIPTPEHDKIVKFRKFFSKLAWKSINVKKVIILVASSDINSATEVMLANKNEKVLEVADDLLMLGDENVAEDSWRHFGLKLSPTNCSFLVDELSSGIDASSVHDMLVSLCIRGGVIGESRKQIKKILKIVHTNGNHTSAIGNFRQVVEDREKEWLDFSRFVQEANKRRQLEREMERERRHADEL